MCWQLLLLLILLLLLLPLLLLLLLRLLCTCIPLIFLQLESNTIRRPSKSLSQRFLSRSSVKTTSLQVFIKEACLETSLQRAFFNGAFFKEVPFQQRSPQRAFQSNLPSSKATSLQKSLSAKESSLKQPIGKLAHNSFCPPEIQLSVFLAALNQCTMSLNKISCSGV